MRVHRTRDRDEIEPAAAGLVRFPTVESILDLQCELLVRTGGTPGILNLGAVDSALYRAKWGPFDGPPDLATRTALLLRGLCQDHPFADGNKRAAFAASDLFAGLNGYLLSATPAEIVSVMLAVAQDHLDLEAIAAWIRRHLRKYELVGDQTP